MGDELRYKKNTANAKSIKKNEEVIDETANRENNRRLEKMLRRFEGKKLLVLGATANEIPLVKRAQELGAYVITTDYNTDFRKSPAKNVSDEYWNVSWSDIDELEKQCRTYGINGVTAGFSEIRIDNMIKLCERLDLPCYVTSKQLAITSVLAH